MEVSEGDGLRSGLAETRGGDAQGRVPEENARNYQGGLAGSAGEGEESLGVVFAFRVLPRNGCTPG